VITNSTEQAAVVPVRTFRRTQMEMGVGKPGSWFVYDRAIGAEDWHLHCGPYSTREQAEDWINGIREQDAR